MDWSQSNGFEEPFTDQMNKYLKDLGTKFSTAVSLLANENMRNSESNDDDSGLNEILHHALFCNNLLKSIIKPEKGLTDEVSELIIFNESESTLCYY